MSLVKSLLLDKNIRDITYLRRCGSDECCTLSFLFDDNSMINYDACHCQVSESPDSIAVYDENVNLSVLYLVNPDSDGFEKEILQEDLDLMKRIIGLVRVNGFKQDANGYKVTRIEALKRIKDKL